MDIKISVFALSALAFISATSTYSGTIDKTNKFSSGEPISSSKMNKNFEDIVNELNARESRIAKLETGNMPVQIVGLHKTNVQSNNTTSWVAVTWNKNSLGNTIADTDWITITPKFANSSIKFEASISQGGQNDTFGQYLVQYKVNNGAWVDFPRGPTDQGTAENPTFTQHQDSTHGEYELNTVHYSLVYKIPYSLGDSISIQVLFKGGGRGADAARQMRINRIYQAHIDYYRSTATSSISLTEIAP